MPQTHPLLTALAAEPDSQMQRLTYADWLEEHGDVWASVFRSGQFCTAMNWRPNDTVWAGPWENAAVLPHDAVYALPATVFALLPPDFHAANGIEFTPQESIAAANRAFIQAWCTGWRPTQADCRGEVRLPGGPAYQLVATREATRHTSTWPLIFNRTFLAGRGPDNHLTILWDRFVSRSHFSACLRVDRLHVEVHTNTRHPAIFNGTEQRRLVLSPGETFQVGETLFRFEEVHEN